MPIAIKINSSGIPNASSPDRVVFTAIDIVELVTSGINSGDNNPTITKMLPIIILAFEGFVKPLLFSSRLIEMLGFSCFWKITKIRSN